MANTRPLFGFSKQTSIQFLQRINVKNNHQSILAGIWTHSLSILSILHQPLDRGSRPWTIFLHYSPKPQILL